MNDRLNAIRESERRSHETIYSSEELYKTESWLKKPIKTVLELVPLFKEYERLNILDLGCGVGRNCFPFAAEYKGICSIDCVDILEIAINGLYGNSEELGVTPEINGIVSAIEDFSIQKEHYDLIMAVSALEHIDSRASFEAKLQEINCGLHSGGVVCLVINTDVREFDKADRSEKEAQFEVNLSTAEMKGILTKAFDGFNVIKYVESFQTYDIPRDGAVNELRTNVITFVAKKGR